MNQNIFIVVLKDAKDYIKWIKLFLGVIKISNETDSKKLKVEIYVPLDACACEWDKFMNRVFVELTPYIKHIDYDTKNLNSEEARQLNLHNKCIVVDGDKKISSSFTLKNELPKLLKAKGFI
ncbi:MAG: hypothetical protein ACFFDN_52730 [Candidatus Hodarchaeota archaeon]